MSASVGPSILTISATSHHSVHVWSSKWYQQREARAAAPAAGGFFPGLQSGVAQASLPSTGMNHSGFLYPMETSFHSLC